MKLLLHSCCGPCSVECVFRLREMGISPDLFWYNPNIHPFVEYQARKNTLMAFANEENLNRQIVDEYGLRKFIAEAPEAGRCSFCYKTRLEKTALQAKEGGYDSFSTSLLISPYQNHETIKKTGEECASRYNIEFFYHDFRPGFYEGKKKARERGYYMQKYCGCIFSSKGTGERG